MKPLMVMAVALTIALDCSSAAAEPSAGASQAEEKHEPRAVYDILFKAGSPTLLTIAADPKHLGARIGLTAILHTWGSALTHHPHVHCIVPGGGLSLKPAPAEAGGLSWISCRPRFFLPVLVLSRRCCQPKDSRAANARSVAGADGQVQDPDGSVSLV